MRLWIISFQYLGASTLILRSELGYHFEFYPWPPVAYFRKFLFCFRETGWVIFTFDFWTWHKGTYQKWFLQLDIHKYLLYKHFVNIENIKSWQKIFLKISFDDLRLCLLITAKNDRKIWKMWKLQCDIWLFSGILK